MSDFIAAHVSEILSAIVGAIGGALISVPITLRVSKKVGSMNVVDQRRAKSGRDVIGRDRN